MKIKTVLITIIVFLLLLTSCAGQPAPVTEDYPDISDRLILTEEEQSRIVGGEFLEMDGDTLRARCKVGDELKEFTIDISDCIMPDPELYELSVGVSIFILPTEPVDAARDSFKAERIFIAIA